MKIDFLGLEAFVCVAQLGSFTRAAERMSLSQTAITHRISKLERSLGTKLFTRSARELSLTPSGLELLPKVSDLIDGLARELTGLSQTGRGAGWRLTVACLPTIATTVLPGPVRAFITRHPSAAVRILDTVAVDVPTLVRNGAAELGITIAAAGSDELAMEPLFTEPYLLVCPEGHRLARRSHVSWSDLRGEKLIRVAVQTANRYVLDQALGAQSESQDWAYEVQHTVTALRLVQAGAGLTVAPRSALLGLEGASLCSSELRGPRVKRTISIITRRGVPLSPLAQSFKLLLKRGYRRRTSARDAA